MKLETARHMKQFSNKCIKQKHLVDSYDYDYASATLLCRSVEGFMVCVTRLKCKHKKFALILFT